MSDGGPVHVIAVPDPSHGPAQPPARAAAAGHQQGWEESEEELENLIEPHAQPPAQPLAPVEHADPIKLSLEPAEAQPRHADSASRSVWSACRLALSSLSGVAVLLVVVLFLQQTGTIELRWRMPAPSALMSAERVLDAPRPVECALEERSGATETRLVQPRSVDSAGEAGEQFVWQYELCPRADSASEESDLSRVDINHFQQPFGAAAFPSFTVPMSAVMPTFHPELAGNDPKPRYVELYLLAVFWLADTSEWKVAVNALYENDAGIADSHYWHFKHDDAVHSVAAKLALTLTLQPSTDGSADGSASREYGNASFASLSPLPWPLQARVDRIVSVQGLWWLYFPSPLPVQPPGAAALPVLLSLTHPDMSTSSTACTDSAAHASSGWCSRSSLGLYPPLPFLRFSMCPLRYRPVSFAWCSNALRTERLVPHIRSFLTYHAYLGIQRFIIFDRGGYRSVLQPFIDSGLVEYRFWPFVNRDFSSSPDNWSQQGLINICSHLHQHTSTFWGLFDVDEWLHIARPEQQLPADQLEQAREVGEPIRSALRPLELRQPPSCLRFHPQPLAAEPDLSLDASAYSHYQHPLQHCDSMLATLFRALPLDVERRQLELSERLHADVRSATDQGGLKEALAKQRKLLGEPRGRYAHMQLVPIWVFNYDETAAQQKTRKDTENIAQAAFEAAKQRHIASAHPSDDRPSDSDSDIEHYKGTFYTGSPERFQYRSRKRHTNHKAFYRSSKPRDDTWIHPWSEPEQFVNPNIVRFHHYMNVMWDRTTGDGSAQVVDTCAMEVWSRIVALNQLNSSGTGSGG